MGSAHDLLHSGRKSFPLFRLTPSLTRCARSPFRFMAGEGDEASVVLHVIRALRCAQWQWCSLTAPPIVCRIFTGRNAESPHRCANSSVDDKDQGCRGIRETLQKTDSYAKIGTVGILKCINARRITGQLCSFTTTKLQWSPVLFVVPLQFNQQQKCIAVAALPVNQCTFPGGLPKGKRNDMCSECVQDQ